MGKNKENKHCRVFINFIFAWLKCRYKGKRTLHYNLPPQLWVTFSWCTSLPRVWRAWAEWPRSRMDCTLPSCHTPPPPPPPASQPHSAVPSSFPQLSLSSPTSRHKIRWSIYLSKFVILPGSINDHCLLPQNSKADDCWLMFLLHS